MRATFILLLLLCPVRGQDPDAKPLQAALAKGKETFKLIELKNDGTRTDLDVDLGSDPVTYKGEDYDGFRFICPQDISGRDFVWYFNAPATRTGWYIMPVEQEPTPAFKDWLNADKAYQSFDKAGEQDRFRAFQTLEGDYFKPGAEYVMWFRTPETSGSEMMRGAAAFAKTKASWDHSALEEALSLSAAPLEQQVAALHSRGGKILLDEKFFDRSYAKGRIDSCFASIRATKKMRGGYFVSMQTTVPTSTTSPSLEEIIRKYGPPDFIRTSAEQGQVRKHAGGDKGEEKDEPQITRYHYDYFSFEVKSGVENPKVLRVGTHGSDFSPLRAPEKGNTFANVEIENLTVFHRDGKEVGRAYYFLEGAKSPLFITRPPEGDYRLGNLSLVSNGNGKWTWLTLFPDGTPARRMILEADRFQGP
ncbi:MAG: hypothetical protein EOP88_23935, partial [Verrucomicrobiaceae bacterium]